MKKFSEYILEGIEPTEIDTAGTDQNLDNVGTPYIDKEFNKTVDDLDDEEKIEREYQKKIFDLMKKNQPETDPSKLDPTQGPEGETSGGIVDGAVRKYLKDMYKKVDDSREKVHVQRNKVNVKTTSTYFMQDKKKLFSPRNDEFKDANADLSSDSIS